MNLWSADSEQNWYKYVVDIFTSLAKFKVDNPDITEAYVFTDGAGNLNHNAVIMMMMESQRYTGIRIVELDNNEGGEGKQILDTYFSQLKANAKSAMNFFKQWDSVESLVQLFNYRDGTQGGLSVQQEPRRAFEPTVRDKGVGKAMANRSICLCHVFNYSAGSEVAGSVTVFENAGIGKGRCIPYDDVRKCVEAQDEEGQLSWTGFRANLQDLITLPGDVKSLSSFLKPNEKRVKGKRGGRKAKAKPATNAVHEKSKRKRRPYKKFVLKPTLHKSTLYSCHTCKKQFYHNARFLLHEINGKCQRKKEVVQAVSGVAADKVANGTVMPIPERHSFVPATRFPTTVVVQGHGRNLYREAAQRFSEASKKQLTIWFHEGNQDKLNRAKASSKKRRTEDDMAQFLLENQLESCPADLTASLFKIGLKKRIKSWLSSFSSQEKKRVSNVSLASKQKCDMAADVAAVVHSLMPDVIADMEIEAGDDPTEAEKLTPMMPVSSLPKEPKAAAKKKTAKSKPKHPEEPTRATAPAIQPAAAKAASKPPQPPIQVTSTGRTVKPNSLVNFTPQ